MIYYALGLLVILLIVWIIATQRKLVGIEELVRNALSQIGVQLNSRWDALKALVDLTKSYNEHEYNTLQELVAKRSSLGSSSSTAQVEGEEANFSQTFSRLLAVGEAYPELKASGVYIQTMDSLNNYENQVRRSRMVYNDSVTKLNRALRVFPTSLIAGLLGFRQREYLETDQAKAEMPPMA